MQYKIVQTWVFLDDAYRILDNIMVDFSYYLYDGHKAIQESEVGGRPCHHENGWRQGAGDCT